MIRPDLMVINTTNQTAAMLDACKKQGQHGRRRGMLSAGHPEHPVKVMIVEVGYNNNLDQAELDSQPDCCRQLQLLVEVIQRTCMLHPGIYGYIGYWPCSMMCVISQTAAPWAQRFAAGLVAPPYHNSAGLTRTSVVHYKMSTQWSKLHVSG